MYSPTLAEPITVATTELINTCVYNKLQYLLLPMIRKRFCQTYLDSITFSKSRP